MTEKHRVPLKEISNLDIKRDSRKKGLNQLKVGAGPAANDVNGKKKGKKGAVSGEKSKENEGEKELVGTDRKVIGSLNRSMVSGVQVGQEGVTEKSKESEAVGQEGDNSSGPIKGKCTVGGENIGKLKLGLSVECSGAEQGIQGWVLEEQNLDKRLADFPDSDMVLDQPEPPDPNESKDYMGLSAVEKCMEAQGCMSEERMEINVEVGDEKAGN